MASFRRALPSLARCERPRKAFSRFLRDQPGRLAQGPEEKQILAGRLAGLAVVVMSLPLQIDAPRWGGVSRRRMCPTTEKVSRNKGLCDLRGVLNARNKANPCRELLIRVTRQWHALFLLCSTTFEFRFVVTGAEVATT